MTMTSTTRTIAARRRDWQHRTKVATTLDRRQHHARGNQADASRSEQAQKAERRQPQGTPVDGPAPRRVSQKKYMVNSTRLELVEITPEVAHGDADRGERVIVAASRPTTC